MLIVGVEVEAQTHFNQFCVLLFFVRDICDFSDGLKIGPILLFCPKTNFLYWEDHAPTPPII